LISGLHQVAVTLDLCAQTLLFFVTNFIVVLVRRSCNSCGHETNRHNFSDFVRTLCARSAWYRFM